MTRREALALAAGLAAAGPAASQPRPPAKTTLYYGADTALPEPLVLRAGPLSMLFEPHTGYLRYIRLGERELVRAVYSAVRDRDWDTIQPRIHHLKLESTEAGFELRFDAECKRREIDFFWSGAISGAADGTVRFAMSGTARSTFWRNRIGFCVLHPIREYAGRPCLVETTGGARTPGVFPRSISPHQPFFDLRAISDDFAEVRFEGEVFEMEDQRNWTDASYKTYCTPLRIPYPVEVKAGAAITQAVTVRLKAGIPAARSAESPVVTVQVGAAAAGPVPRLGLGMGQPLTPPEVQRLLALKLSHLRVDLRPGTPGFAPALRRAAAESKALGIPLEAALFLSDAPESELKALVQELAAVKPAVAVWLVHRADAKPLSAAWLQTVRRSLGPGTPIAAGADTSFVEVNRARPPVEAIDRLCYSINPQVHAIDIATLAENLEAQRDTVLSARQFAGGRPIMISPVTLKLRYNPNATQPPKEPAPDELPANVDVRQASLFGAGWTVGSLKYLAESGVHSATYYETTGWRGVMETATGSPPAARFPSIPGAVFPLYHVLADVGEFGGESVWPSASSAPLQVESLALRSGNRWRILLANLSARPQIVRVTGAELGGSARVKRLDESSADAAMRQPERFRAETGLLMETGKGGLELFLLPYAVLRVG